nr:MAG TPA: hypothetical protein [Caudoviricetes sp.]
MRGYGRDRSRIAREAWSVRGQALGDLPWVSRSDRGLPGRGHHVRGGR